MFPSDDPRTLLNCPCFYRLPALEALPVAPALPLPFLLPRRRFPVALLRLPPRPLPRSRPAEIAAIPLARMPRTKALLASLQKTVPRPRPPCPALPPATCLHFPWRVALSDRPMGGDDSQKLLPWRGF